MKAKVLSLCIALLVGVSVWADDVWNYNVYDDCSMNGYKGGYVPAPADVQAVDLGLPSGIKWASCNIGAEKPEDYGNYYAWGEVIPKENYSSWATYKYANGASNKLTKYCDNEDYGDNDFTDNKTILDPEDDAAHVNWGSSWRMPTAAECQELLDYCTWTWTDDYQGTGIAGRIVTGPNGNSIFLPVAGFRSGTNLFNVGDLGLYWSSSLREYDSYNARYLDFGSFSVYMYYHTRGGGLPVRPVCPSTSTQFSAEDNFTMLTLYANGCERDNGIVNFNVIKCDSGQQINVSAIPNTDYWLERRHFVHWTDGNTDNPRLVTVTQDMTLTAVFAYDQYTITAFGEYGTVEGTGMYDIGSVVELTAVPDKGYHFVKWSNGDTDNPLEVVVYIDTTFTAEFAPNRYTITAFGEHGTVEGTGTYDYNTKVNLTAVPYKDYHFVKWTDGNTDNPRSVMVTQDSTFTAEFALDQYYTITASGEHGKVKGTGTYKYNTKVNLTAVPDEHYHFTQWNDGNTDNPRTVSVVGDATYTAEFAIDQHTITTNAHNGTITGGGTYDYGTTATLTATADAHYHFTQWSDGNTDNPRTIMVTEDATYTAEFTAICNIIVVYDVKQGYVSGDGTYDLGTQVRLVAEPNSGYEFSQWSDGIADNPYIFTAIEDITLEALFNPTTAVENVKADNAEGVQKVLCNGQVYILRNGKAYDIVGREVEF